jgi:hypothetical protein
MANVAVESSGRPIHLTPGHRKGLSALTNGKCGSGELWVADTSHTWTQKRFKECSQIANGGGGGMVSSLRQYITHLYMEKIEERSQMANSAVVSSRRQINFPSHLHRKNLQIQKPASATDKLPFAPSQKKTYKYKTRLLRQITFPSHLHRKKPASWCW